MPNIANVLKEEIARIARKELRAELLQLRTILAKQRSEIAELKRSHKQLLKDVGRAQKLVSNPPPSSSEMEMEAKLRFSANRLAALRAKLGVSAADFGLLTGTSGQSVYKWESGTRPRAKQLQAIAAIRHISARQAAARLAELKSKK